MKLLIIVLLSLGFISCSTKPRPQNTFKSTIEANAIRVEIRENRAQIRKCYENLLDKNPGLSGKLVLNWKIDEKAVVSETRVLESTGNKDLDSCVANEIAKLNFPAPGKNEIAEVSYPFVFSKNTTSKKN